MKKILFASLFAAFGATPVFAADPVYVDPIIEAPAVFSWTGAYVGLHVGYSWGDGDGAYPDSTGLRFETAYPEADGGLIGGQIGYNYQWGSFVLGVEGDISYSAADGEGDIEGFPGGGDVGADIETEYNYLASITARAGYAIDRTLIYAKGGVGFTELEMKDVVTATGFVNSSGSESVTGWTIGGGVEHAFSDHWTVKGEYQFYRFSEDVALDNPPFRVYEDDFDVHTVKIGFNYKF